MNDSISAIAGSERFPAPGYARVPDVSLGEGKISVSFWLNPENAGWPSEFNQMSSAAIHKRQYLSREDIDTKYAPRADVVKAVNAFAAKYDLDKVPELSSLRLLTLRVPIAMVGELFDTRLGIYKSDGEAYRGREGIITLPPQDFCPEIVQGIGGVFGLDNRLQAQSFLRTIPVEGFPADEGFPPAAYGFPSVPGGPPGQPSAGQTIAIVALGGTGSDLRANCPGAGGTVVFSQPDIQQRRSDFATETCTDLRVVSLCAPWAKVALYMADATEQGWVLALNAILKSDPLPSVVSISWGWPEGGNRRDDLWTEAAIRTIEQTFALLALRGTTVCVASGDSGPVICYPGSSAFVLSCGGTRARQASGDGPEQVWSDGPCGDSSGGGISSQIHLPDWQKGSSIATHGAPAHLNMAVGNVAFRLLPDVAGRAVLMPNAGHVAPRPGTSSLEGTSIAAPLWASVIAFANAALASRHLNPVGNINGLLYANSTNLQQTLSDILYGNNGSNGNAPLYSASPGWDACTGWGTPMVSPFIDALLANATPPLPKNI